MKRVSFGILPNGFRFYTRYRNNTHVAGIGVKVGSIHDPPDLSGMAHFAEHVLGTLTPEEELRLEEYDCGPEEQIMVETDRSSTFYGCDLILRREFVFDILGMFAERLSGPLKFITDEKKNLSEKAAIHNEYYLRGKDIPESALDDAVMWHMFENNPARKRVDCELEQLEKLNVEDLKRFVKKYYVAGNMFGVILNVPFKKARAIMEKYFGHLPAKEAPRILIENPRPLILGAKRVEIARPGIHQHHIAVAFPTWPFGHKDDEAVDLLAEILQWRLRNRLRFENQEWAKGVYRAFTNTDRSFAHGIIYAHLATIDKAFSERAVEIVLEECQKLRSGFVLNQEIIAMHNKIFNQHFDAFENSQGILCRMIVESACNGDEEMRELNSFLTRLNRVGKKTLMRVANEYLDIKNHLQVVIVPA